jgi:hypothetical protein
MQRVGCKKLKNDPLTGKFQRHENIFLGTFSLALVSLQK